MLPKTTVETTNYQGIYPIELLVTSRLNPKHHIILVFLSCHLRVLEEQLEPNAFDILGVLTIRSVVMTKDTTH